MNITLIPGDITDFEGDVIVNAANNAGLGGGGVDGAIHRAAGPRLLEACKALPVYEGLVGYAPGFQHSTEVRVPNGKAIPTLAFDLPCKWVFHTAGPVWVEDPDALLRLDQGPPEFPLDESQLDMARAWKLLNGCFHNPALLAMGMGLKSIAYPAISTGVYGCPIETCAEIALRWARLHIAWPLDVTFYLYPAGNLPIWQEVAKRLHLDVTVELG